MDIDSVNPELQVATSRSPRLNVEKRFSRWFISTLMRLLPNTPVSGVTLRRVRVGNLRLRVYIPEHANGGGLLWIHGGGFVVGAAARDDVLCGETARATGVTIVSVDYRLAPRHPFPAALDDCHAGFTWMLDNAEPLGLDSSRFAVGGQSAGGGLAATLVQRLVDEGAPVAAQWLLCPMLDDRTAADRSLDVVNHFVWNNRANLVGWSSYLGGEVGGSTPPRYAVAARRTDLSGLPPTWIYTSDIELFFDEDVDYAKRLEAAGVEVTLDIVSGAPHAFENWASDTDLAHGLLSRARSWLKDQLSNENEAVH